MPQVTIAVPSLNQAQYIESALASITQQRTETEVYVMDGGSSDGTIDILNRWEPALAGCRSHPDGGQSQAINDGIRSGTGEYVCWLNSDDFFFPGGLDTLVASLQSSPNVPAVYGNAWNQFEKSGRRSPVRVEAFCERRLALRCIVSQPATLIRRSVWEELGGLNEELSMALDYDLWWRITKTYGSMRYVDVDVAVNRVHDATKTNKYRRAHYREAMAVVKRHHGSVPLKWWLYQPYAVWWKSVINRFNRMWGKNSD